MLFKPYLWLILLVIVFGASQVNSQAFFKFKGSSNKKFEHLHKKPVDEKKQVIPKKNKLPFFWEFNSKSKSYFV